ncbi:MAG: hypothetical protein D6730_07245 [Bacteroidetes bacterium]|nr:MAG: hypothetical protein D6730_07245 [Bacteroidota bacterium]
MSSEKASTSDGGNPGGRIRATKAQLQEQLTEALSKLQALQAELDDSRKEVKSLQQQLADRQAPMAEASEGITELQSESSSHVEKTPPGPKSTFRIELYDPGAGNYQGKIEHPYTGTKKAFTGLDMVAIESFIRSLLPQSERSLNNQQATKAPASTPDADAIRLKRIVSLHARDEIPLSILEHEQPFRVQLELDTTELDEHYNWSATVYAKTISGKPYPLGKTAEPLVDVPKADLYVLPDTLKPGVYKLEAELYRQQTGGHQWAYQGNKVGDWIQVN